MSALDAGAGLNEAIRLAAYAHKGQTDKAGEPYILHPLRVMLRMTTDETRIIAALHDVVEDSDWTLDLLRAVGFSDAVVQAVDVLTRRDSEGYARYIERVARSPLATAVKLADLEDNLAPTRSIAAHPSLRDRYLRALETLRAASPSPLAQTSRPDNG